MPTARGWLPARILVDEIFRWFHCAYVHGVLVDVLNGFPNALCCFEISAILRPMKALNDLGGEDRFNGFVAHPWEDVNF